MEHGTPRDAYLKFYGILSKKGTVGACHMSICEGFLSRFTSPLQTFPPHKNTKKNNQNWTIGQTETGLYLQANLLQPNAPWSCVFFFKAEVLVCYVHWSNLSTLPSIEMSRQKVVCDSLYMRTWHGDYPHFISCRGFFEVEIWWVTQI